MMTSVQQSLLKVISPGKDVENTSQTIFAICKCHQDFVHKPMVLFWAKKNDTGVSFYRFIAIP